MKHVRCIGEDSIGYLVIGQEYKLKPWQTGYLVYNADGTESIMFCDQVYENRFFEPSHREFNDALEELLK